MPLDNTHQHSSADVMKADDPHTPIDPSGESSPPQVILEYTFAPYPNGGYTDIPALSGFDTVVGVTVVANQRTLEVSGGPSMFIEWSPSPPVLLLFERTANLSTGAIETAQIADDTDPDATVTLLVIGAAAS